MECSRPNSNSDRDGAAIGECKKMLALGTNAMKKMREASGAKLPLAANPSGGKPMPPGRGR